MNCILRCISIYNLHKHDGNVVHVRQREEKLNIVTFCPLIICDLTAATDPNMNCEFSEYGTKKTAWVTAV